MNSKTASPRILFLEDVPDYVEVMETLLRRAGIAGVSLHVDTREGFERALEEFQPDIVLADYKLPAFNGAEALRIVRAQHPDIPLIVVTGMLGDEAAIELLKAGAKDYVLKDNLARLAPAVQRVLSMEQGIRARKAAERALRESEERLRALTEHSSDISTVIAPDGTIRFDSPSITRLLGYAPGELLGRNAFELVHPEDHEKTRASLAAVVRDPGSVHTLEHRLRHKEEGWRVYETKGKFLPDVPGIQGIVLNARDITKRKEADAALRESELKFRTIFEGVLDGILVADPGTRRFHTGNRRICEMLGYTLEELVELGVEDLHPPEALPHAVREFERQLRGETALSMGMPFRRKDGSIFYADIGSSPIMLGDRPYLLGVIRDVTEHKRAEESLRSSRDLLSTVVENIPIRVFWKDGESRYLGCNTLFARDAGKSRPEDMLGKDDLQMDWRDQAELYRADDRAVMDSDTPKLGFEEPQTTPDGRTIWLRTSKVPLHDVGGRVFGILGIYEDITERKQTEDALRRTNRALKTLSACNIALIHAQSESGLLMQICRVIVETSGYAYAWVGYAENEAQGRIRPMAQAGFEPGYLEAQPWRVRDRNPCCTAVREGRMVVARDTSGDLAPAEKRAMLERLGIASIAAFPLASGGQTFGMLSIYSRERDAFDQNELTLLAEMAEDLNFGILTLRARVEHERLQEQHLETAERLKESLADTIRAIALTVEKRDPYTAGHQQRVSELCVAIGRELGLSNDRLEGLRLGASIHDIGKIYIPAEILNRSGRLTSPEFEMIKSHPEVGYDIVKDVDFPWPVSDMILQHHERLDGTGYPRGLKGEAICLEARIIAVADVVEAMSSHRPYRPALGPDQALAEIAQHRGQWHDPSVVDACLRLFREKGFRFN